MLIFIFFFQVQKGKGSIGLEISNVVLTFIHPRY